MSTPCEFFTGPTAPLNLDWSKRNLLINGCGRVVQRGGHDNTLATTDFIIDRWATGSNSGGFASIWDPLGVDMHHYPSFGVRVTTPPTLGTSGYVIPIYQNVEANNTYRLRRGGKVTLSFGVKATVAGVYNVRWYFATDGGGQQYFQEFTIDASDTFEYKELILDVPELYVPGPGVDWGLTVTIGGLGGSNRVIAPGTWSTDLNLTGTHNSVDWAANADNELRVNQVQLEIRDGATEFEDRSYGEELALCQRYFQKFNAMRSGMVENTSSGCRMYHPLPQELRGVPQISNEVYSSLIGVTSVSLGVNKAWVQSQPSDNYAVPTHIRYAFSCDLDAEL